MLSIDEIKTVLETVPEEGAEDNRVDTVAAELAEREERIASLEASVTELTDKVSSLVETNSKLAEAIKYTSEAAEEEAKDDEPEVEFADLEDLYEED